MQYQDCAFEVQADEVDAKAYALGPVPFGLELADANINPQTGLATDYLNHFNEAIMLLEMVSGCPDCLTDFLDWQPMSYREHFLESHFKGRDLAIAAYAGADPAARAQLDTLARAMTSVIEASRASLTSGMTAPAAGELASRSADWLRQMVAHAGAVINGDIDGRRADAPQAIVDRLMLRVA